MSETLQQYLTSPKVPSLPAVAMQVLEMTRDESVEFAEMALVIENDQALSSKVLRTVNSSYYGLSKKCETIKQAMVYLGINAVKTIVLGFSLVDAIDGGDDVTITFDYVTYWQQSLFAAVAAREVAVMHRQCDPDVAFLGALISGIGQVAMYRVLGDKYLQALDMCKGDPRTLPNIEAQSFDITSNQVGAALAESWKFPPSLVECLAFAQTPGDCDPEHRAVVRTVGLATVASFTMLQPSRESTVKWFSSNATRWFDMNSTQTSAVLNAIRTKTGELASMFRIKNPDPSELDRMLHDAEAQLAEVQLRLQRENDMLRQRVEQLQKIARVDEAIGIATRDCLDGVLAQQFKQAQQQRQTFAMFLIRLDGFESFKDRAGDHAALQVRRVIGEYLTNEISIRGMITIYEENEFAVIVNTPNVAVATTLADQLRNEIRSMSFEKVVGNIKTDLTASIGLACFEPPLSEMLREPSDLVSIVERAVAAASDSGSDCVRVFKPAAKKAA